MKQSKFLTYFTHKHKLSMRRVISGDEVWHIFTSRGKLLVILLSLFSILTLGIFGAVIYTPIADVLPGNIGSQQREMLVSSIMRIDSLEREVSMWQNYTVELQEVLEGKVRSKNSTENIDSLLSKQQGGVVGRSSLDSLLRDSFLSHSKDLQSNSINNRGISFEMISPISGTITSSFAPKRGRYGIVISTVPNSVVLSVLDGTVILSSWNPQDGYIVGVQHSSSILTFYKGLQKSLKSIGTSVRAGEGIGISGVIVDGKQPEINFEMWNSGNAVNPENFIHF